jgi:hypothetical protein
MVGILRIGQGQTASPTAMASDDHAEASDWSRSFFVMDYSPPASGYKVYFPGTTVGGVPGPITDLEFPASAWQYGYWQQKDFGVARTDWKNPFLFGRTTAGGYNFREYIDGRFEGLGNSSPYQSANASISSTLTGVNYQKVDSHGYGTTRHTLTPNADYPDDWEIINGISQEETGQNPNVSADGVTESATAAGPVTKQVTVPKIMVSFLAGVPINALPVANTSCGTFTDVDNFPAHAWALNTTVEWGDVPSGSRITPGHYSDTSSKLGARHIQWYGYLSYMLPQSFDYQINLGDFVTYLESQYSADYHLTQQPGDIRQGTIFIFSVREAQPSFDDNYYRLNPGEMNTYAFQAAMMLSYPVQEIPVYGPPNAYTGSPATHVGSPHYVISVGSTITIVFTMPGVAPGTSGVMEVEVGEGALFASYPLTYPYPAEIFNGTKKLLIRGTIEEIMQILNTLKYTAGPNPGLDVLTIRFKDESGQETLQTHIVEVGAAPIGGPLLPPLEGFLRLSPVCWYPGENNPYDREGGNHGTVHGGVSYAEGVVGQSFNFDGTSGYVQVPSRNDLKFTGPFTVEAWIKFHSITPACGDVLVAKGPDAPIAGDWLISVSENAKLRPHLATSQNWNYFDCGTVLDPETWYHVAMVYDGTTLKGYVNGVEDGSMAVFGTVLTSDNPMKIGAYAPVNGDWTKAFFPGQVDELTIFNRALSAEELRNIYNAGNVGKPQPPCIPAPASLISTWKAEGNVNDSKGTRNGTAYGGLTYTGGKVGQAFNMTGSQYVSIPSDSGISPSGAISVEAWVNYSSMSPDGANCIVAKSPDQIDVGDWALFIMSDGKLRPHVRINGAWQNPDSNAALQPGKWYHVAMIYNGTKLQLYIDGALDKEWPFPGTVGVSTNPLKIGIYAPNQNYGTFRGLIDEVSFYNGALTASDIQSIYNAGPTGKCLP